MTTETAPAITATDPTAAPPPAAAGHPKRWLILFVVLAVECMDLLDGTIVNVAAPSIQRRAARLPTALQWIVGGYALALAVGLITGGRLGDLFGRRRLFIVGIVGFTACSLLCGIAPNTACSSPSGCCRAAPRRR